MSEDSSNPNKQVAGVYLRLARAEELLDSLHLEIDKYRRLYRPYTTQIWNVDRTVVRVILHLPKEPEASWGIKIGEILYNTRSALDHMIVALVADGKDKRYLEFPIFNNNEGFANLKRNDERNPKGPQCKLVGVPTEAREIIEASQPFNGPGTDWENNNRRLFIAKHPLWRLHMFNNMDKHRTLHIVTTGMIADGSSSPSMETLTKLISNKAVRGPVHDGEIVYEARFNSPIPDGQFNANPILFEVITEEVNYQAPIFGMSPYYITLGEIINAARKVVDELNSYINRAGLGMADKI